MAVTTNYNPITKQATVTITFDGSALRKRADDSKPSNLAGETLPQHQTRHFKGLLAEAACAELNRAVAASAKTDVELDAEIATKTAEINALKAARPA